MDDLTFLVASAQLKLRIERLSRHPELWRNDKMATPFLQGLTKAMDMLEHDLEEDAKGLTTKIQSVGARGKAAFAKGHARVDGVASRVAEVDKFVTAIEGSNGGEALGNSSGSSAEESSQKSEEKPEELTVNGVSKTL